MERELDLAVAAATPVLVSGDADLLELQHTVKPLLILSPGDCDRLALSASTGWSHLRQSD